MFVGRNAKGFDKPPREGFLVLETAHMCDAFQGKVGVKHQVPSGLKPKHFNRLARCPSSLIPIVPYEAAFTHVHASREGGYGQVFRRVGHHPGVKIGEATTLQLQAQRNTELVLIARPSQEHNELLSNIQCHGRTKILFDDPQGEINTRGYTG